MNWPPMLMHIKVKNEENDFGIWIPFILIMLVALAVIIALSPLIILAFIIMLMVGIVIAVVIGVGVYMLYIRHV